MRTPFIACYLLLCCYTGKAQTAAKMLTAPYLKATANSQLHRDAFSPIGNQAALARFTSLTAGIFGERKFMLEELQSFTAALALPTNSGVFGLQIHQTGNAAYAQMQGGLAYGRKLSDKVDAGVQFNFYSMRISGYGNATAVSIEAGAMFHFTSQLHGGFHVSNPTSARLGKTEEKLPSVYSFGLGYDASEQFFISAEIEKAEDESLGVTASIQYRFTDRLLVRGGVETGSSLIFFGIGSRLQNFRLDVIASLHPQLGISPGLLLIFTKKEKE